MGGDDLGSDDDYLAAPVGEYGGDDNSSVEDANDSEDPPPQKNQKRQRADNAGTNSATKTTKSKKRGGPMEILGSKIRMESSESKAEILSEFCGAEFQAVHMAKLSSKNQNYDVDQNIDSNNFMDRLLCVVSKKQLKNKQQQRSPRAVIFCLSARRSVAVLKDLAPMKLRVAKLFPKQGTIGEQARQLETTEFGIAVGTPHRIKELIDRGSLTLKNTQLLGLDTFLNPKNQSVYTLHDTVPHLKSILKDHAQPVCQMKNKDLKIGFV
jgi:hypothetical protein